MILVITGSQNFQFNRLIEQVDILNISNRLPYKVFAQIGHSTYSPTSFQYKKFVSKSEMNDLIKKAKIIISHAGSASITSALKANKKIICIPRLKKYNEHIDDHQLEITSKFKELEVLEVIISEDDLHDAIKKIEDTKYNKFVFNNVSLINSIKAIIDE